MTLARENQANFDEYLNNNPQANPGIDLTFTVLTTGFWPSYKSFDLSLPAEMVCFHTLYIFGFFSMLLFSINLFWFTSNLSQVKCVEVFREFYQTKTKHRKLTWIYSLGTCNINGKFEPKTMELIVTTYQVPSQQAYFRVAHGFCSSSITESECSSS